MGSPLNLAGKRFGKISVGTLHSTTLQGRKWNVICDCGNRFLMFSKKIKKSCPKCAIKQRGIDLRLDLTGETFGRWKVDSFSYSDGQTLWLCTCVCGTKRTIHAGDLRTGHSKSCGCINRDNPPGKRHGMTDTRFYSTWVKMLRRTRNKNSRDFYYYGAKGIKTCKRWYVFDTFMQDMWVGYQDASNKFGEKNVSLERIDVFGDYTPENCKWIDISEQARNKRNTLWVVFKGEKICLKQFSRLIGQPYNYIWYLYHNRKLDSLYNVTIVD